MWIGGTELLSTALSYWHLLRYEAVSVAVGKTISEGLLRRVFAFFTLQATR